MTGLHDTKGQTLPHERLDVFNCAIELVEHVARIDPPRGNGPAMDQLRRAFKSSLFEWETFQIFPV